MYSPFTKISYILSVPPASLEQFLRAIWGAVSQTTVFILPQIKLNSQNSIETCILSTVKQITSPGWMHETSAQTWCTGSSQRDRVDREVGGGIGMGNTCKSMADSCQCMTKTTTIL